MGKTTFGEWLTLQISRQSGNECAPNRVIRVDAGYFNFSGIADAAKSINKAVFQAQLEGRKLNNLEILAVEVLLAMANLENVEDAQKKYMDYLYGSSE